MAEGKSYASVIVPLNDSNYSTWKLQIKMALVKEGLWGIVNETEEIPVPDEDEDEKIQRYILRQDRALALIVLSIEPALLYLLGDPQDPVEVWEKLAKQFQRKTWANKLALRRKLYGMKLKEKEPIQKHIKSMMEVFDKLCVIGDAIEEEDRVVHLLASLPSSYDMLVTALEASSEVPKLETVTERLLHEEGKLKEKNSGETSNPKAFTGRHNAYNKKDISQKQCYCCDKYGHLERDCPENEEKQVRFRQSGNRGKGRRQVNRFQRNGRESANMSSARRSVRFEEDSDSSDCSAALMVTHALSSTSEPVENEKWIVDSGATCHMSNDASSFVTLNDLERPEQVKVGDGYYIPGEGRGPIKMNVEISPGVVKKIRLKDVLYVPSLSYNLLSVSTSAENNMKITMDSEGCEIIRKDTNAVVATGRKVGSLYYLNCVTEKSEQQSIKYDEPKNEISLQVQQDNTNNNNNNDEDETIILLSEDAPPKQQTCESLDASEEVRSPRKSTKEEIWHQRYGHLGVDNLKKLVDDDLVDGFQYNPSKELEFCEPCAKGKQHKKKFPKVGGKRASEKLGIVHTDVCGKIEVKSIGGCEYFLTFIDDKSRFIWVYGLKFKSEVFSKFLEWKARAERQSDQRLKILRSDNGGEYISDEFETYLKQEGIRHQTTVRKTPEQNGVAERGNRTLVEAIRSILAQSGVDKRFWGEALATVTYLRNRSPTKAVTGKTPFEAWNGSKPCIDHLRIFGSICYAHVPKDERKKLDVKTRKAILLGYGTETKGYRLYDVATHKVFYSRDVIFDEGKFLKDTNHEIRRRNDDVKEPEDRLIVLPNDDSDNDAIIEEQSNIEANEPLTENDDVDHPPDENDNIARPQRARKTPDLFGEWVNAAMHTAEPKSVKEATSGDEFKEWNEAMNNEMQSLDENHVWELAELPAGRKAIGCKWIFKRKADADGNIERYKARLVAQGYNQKFGIDYEETFSPVVRFESVRTVIALAAKHGLILHQMDVKTAFLNGELKEEIYMKQPTGFTVKGKETLVCRLKRSIYGLKQSARCWNTELDNHLKNIGFSQSESDPCIYIQTVHGVVFVIAVYVDDIILAGEGLPVMKKVKTSISGKFNVTDMGELHHFLGVKVTQKPGGEIWIGQATYARELLVRLQMSEAKPVDTPIDSGAKLVKATEGEQCADKTQYQSAVGSLLYLSTRTRPDLAYAVGVVAKFSSNPTILHWSAVKRILRYLNGTIDLGLTYGRGDNFNLVGFSDADWAGDLDDRKSTTGYLFLLSGGPISWRSKKQSCVALSTAEAEYMALSAAIQEAVWLRRLISTFTEHKDEAVSSTTIYEDNQSAICMSRNRQFHGRSKHIDIKFHYVREQVQAGSVDVQYCNTQEMIADMFTKGLCGPQFKKLRGLLGMTIYQN